MAIASTIVRIYSDALCQNLVTSASGTTSLTQTVSVSGLNASTTYYAKAFATNTDNLTGESAVFSFSTAATGYVFSNYSVEYENDFDTLFAAVDVAGPAGTHFIECGVEFCTNSQFSGNVISASNTSSPADFFSGDVTGFAEHTTYYYRFFADSTEYGYQTFAPQNNTITTLYDEPTLTITASSVTDVTAAVTFSYVGNYPVDTTTYSNMNAFYKVDGSGTTPITLQFRDLDNNVPETLYFSGLTPNTTYYVEWNVEMYSGETYEKEITQAITFTTLGATPVVTITGVSNITPSGADINLNIS